MNKCILKCDVDDHNTNTGENLSLLPWIGILDIFGFEHFEHGNHFETFLVSVVVVIKSFHAHPIFLSKIKINTANESVQDLFNLEVLEVK